MSLDYGKLTSRKVTPQSEPARDDQLLNDAGGYVFRSDPFNYLARFLVMGSEGGTYYTGERELTKRNASNLEACLKADHKRAVDLIVEISLGGRAPKNDPAVFALALAASVEVEDKFFQAGRRGYALEALPKVCRTGTHLFQFVHFVEQFRGWGHGLRKAVAGWYASKAPERLAYQVTKYRSRKFGEQVWTHGDLLRLSHAKPTSKGHAAIYRWAASGLTELEATREVVRRRHDGSKGPVRSYEGADPDALDPRFYAIAELEEMRESVYRDEVPQWLREHDLKVIKAISTHGLTQEMIPTEAKRSPDVWGALLESNMGTTAMIRNLGKMTQVKVLEQLSDGTRKVIDRLRDGARLRKDRIHPITVLVAMKAYGLGRSIHTDRKTGRPRLTWEPVPQILEAMDEAFYGTFDNVEPTGKKTIYGLDVSGSMGHTVGELAVTRAEVSAAMSLILMRTEPNYAIFGFCDGLVNLKIGPRMRLDDVARKVRGLTYGGTDCALIATFAKENQLGDLEAIVLMTDEETWVGGVHPYQALEAYRRWSGVPTRQVVLSMEPTEFSIADPRDPLSLDVAGFDTSVPNIIGDFLRGNLDASASPVVNG